MKSKLLILLIALGSLPGYAFDLEDYATTYRATRDASMKAGNELGLAYGPFLQAFSVAKKMEAACYRLKDYQFNNFNGLFLGTCAKDGSLPYKNGGPKLADGGTKIGDKLANLINSLPLGASVPSFDADMERYRAWRDQGARAHALSKSFGLEEIPDCVPSNLSLNLLIKKAVDQAIANGGTINDALDSTLLSDYFTTLSATRDAFLKAANESQLAIGPYKSAMDAYKAATAVYVTVSRCSAGSFTRRGYQNIDPFDYGSGD